jgi:hypothetical protein
MTFRQALKNPRREPIIEKKENRAPVLLSLPVAGDHEFCIKFSKLPTPQISDKEIHDITIELEPLSPCRFAPNYPLRKNSGTNWSKPWTPLKTTPLGSPSAAAEFRKSTKR